MACSRQVLPPADAGLVARLIARADAALRPKWRLLGPELDAAVAQLRTLVTTDAMYETVAELRRAASLAPNESLTTTIVLVSNPSANESLGTGEDSAYVVELDRRASAVERLGIIVHELAHLAQARSVAAPNIERALVGHGMAGVIAANLWVESAAAAFGNGWCVDRLEPALRDARSLYANPAVDRVAHGLLRQWRAGKPFTFDAPVADELLDALGADYPATEWTVADLLGRSVAFSRDESIAAVLRMRSRSSLGSIATRHCRLTRRAPTAYALAAFRFPRHRRRLPACPVTAAGSAARAWRTSRASCARGRARGRAIAGRATARARGQGRRVIARCGKAIPSR